MNAYLLSIGDELVLGQTVDTNSAWICQQLAAVGCDILAHKTVGDDQRAIEQAIKDATQIADVLIISGGIGPTEDDLTRQAIAAVMNVPLELNQKWFDHMKTWFETLGRKMPDTNRIQAMIPQGATMIWNTCGTAAGVRTELKAADLAIDDAYFVVNKGHVCTVFSMPGVPREMKAMFANDVLPYVKERSGGAVILQKTLHTFGIGESTVGERLGTLMMRQRNPSVGTTVAQGLVSLRINARYESLERATKEINETITACREKLGDLIFGEDQQTLVDVVHSLLMNSEGVTTTVATAESCTGGLLAKYLTDTPGSSTYFKQGWVTYSNEGKKAQLGVQQSTLQAHGAVSEATVIEMAQGARRASGADVAISISGIAGPDGGTEDKPVGTVCLALASDRETYARRFVFHGQRDMVRDRAAKMGLSMIRFHLLKKPLPF